MPRAVDGLGGGPLGTTAEPPPPELADTGTGTVLIRGVLVTLNASVAAVCWMTFWRSASRTRPDLPTDTCATAAPSGSVTEPGRPVITSRAMAVTATVADAAVTMKTPTRLRLGRLACCRLRCCDNAVLPSAMHGRAERPARGPLRYRAASRMTAGPDFAASAT